MFGHLKPEDFTNLVEGTAIPPRRRAHLEKCDRCLEQWNAVQSVHLTISGAEDDIVEPDWSEFRASIREEMLSRSARRSAENHRWVTWKLAPAGLSVAAALVIGLFLSRFIMPPIDTAPPTPPQVVSDFPIEDDSPEVDDYGLETEMAVWTRASAFDDALSLGPEESERFRALLEDETRRAMGEVPSGAQP
jgi:hypothetical protein